MANATLFFCTECGHEQPRWSGQCPACKTWNSMKEAPKAARATKTSGKKGTIPAAALSAWGHTASKAVHAVDIPEADERRLTTHMAELDRVLGGGLVAGSVVLVGGDPGIGKSTLLIQIASRFAADMPALYITGEESLAQVSARGRRLELPLDALWLASATNLAHIHALLAEHTPRVLVIDSIQTMYSEDSSSLPGSVSQVRATCSALVQYAKQHQCCVLIAGHVTKEGSLAGPRVLEHMVDTVLYFEGDSRYRLLRAFKNRFGAVNELAVFVMQQDGLVEVKNPSAIFLSARNADAAGSVAVALKEGTRALLIEVQALVDRTQAPMPRRVSVGSDLNRLQMLLSILHRHCGVQLYQYDVFINIVGGLKVQETGMDLAILCALVSSLSETPLPLDLLVFGEVGLSGEIRPVSDGQARLNEAHKQGFMRAVIPHGNAPKEPIGNMQITPAKTLKEAITALFPNLP